MNIALSSRAHLARAKKYAASDDPEDLPHAALELRLSIEARLHDYADRAREFTPIPENAWQIKELRRRVSAVFSANEKPLSLRLIDKKNKTKIEIYYIPVSKKVQTIGARLGGYLHWGSLTKIRTAEDFASLRALLQRGIEEMDYVHRGTLRGPPLQAANGSITLSLEMGHNADADALLNTTDGDHLLEMRFVVTEKTAHGIKISPK